MPVAASPQGDCFRRSGTPHSSSADLYKREIKFVGLGKSSAVVDAQIQEVHGVAAARFLRTGTKLGYVQNRSKDSADSNASQQMYKTSGFKRSNGTKGVHSKCKDLSSEFLRCEMVGNELQHECDVLKQKLTHSLCPFDLSYQKCEADYCIPAICATLENDQPWINHVQPQDRTTQDFGYRHRLHLDSRGPSGFYSAVCKKYGISSASELETLLHDWKSTEASTSVNKGKKAGDVAIEVSENVVLSSDEHDDTISIALYLRDEFSPAADVAKASAYKFQLIAELSAVLRAHSKRFDVRGLFDGVVAEVFLRPSSDGPDGRPPLQLAEELNKYIATKPAILEGTQILRNAINVKIRGHALKVRPLSFLMGKLEAQKTINVHAEGVDEASAGPAKGKTARESNPKMDAQFPIMPSSQVGDSKLIISCDACEQTDSSPDDKCCTIVEVMRSFVGDKCRGELELAPGMSIAVLGSDGRGWCFGNVVKPGPGERQYPAGWFPAEFVRRHDPIAVVSEITLDSSSQSCVSENSCTESDIEVVEHYDDDDDDCDKPKVIQASHWEHYVACQETKQELQSSSKLAPDDNSLLDNQLWRLQIGIMEAESLPPAHTIGLLPDTYVCISLLCADQCDEPGMIIDHCVDSERAVDEAVLQGSTVFRIPPQAKTSIVERSKTPFWGETFDFSETRPYFSVISDSQGRKLVSSDLHSVIRGQDIRVIITLHERNLFGPDCWIARSEILVSSSTGKSHCLETWIVLRQFDGSPIISPDTGSISRVRMLVNYSLISYPENFMLADPKVDTEWCRNTLCSRNAEHKVEGYDFQVRKTSKNQCSALPKNNESGLSNPATNSADSQKQARCDFSGIEKLTHTIGNDAKAAGSRSAGGHKVGFEAGYESSASALTSCSNSNSVDELVSENRTSDVTAATLLMPHYASTHRKIRCCVEIDLISASNLRKSPCNGLNPSPYFCVSLVSNALVNHVNAGHLNHPVPVRGDWGPALESRDPIGFEVYHQYRSAVVRHSQVPSWKPRIVLYEALEYSDNQHSHCGGTGYDLQVAPMQLMGQSVTMLISLHDKGTLVPDRFLGKVIIPFQHPGKDFEQNFPFLNRNGDLMDSSHGYLHIRCRYKASQTFDIATPQHCLQSPTEADFDLSVTSTSTCRSESSFSADSSPRQHQSSDRNEPVNETRRFPLQYNIQTRLLNSSNAVPNSARSGETESSMLKTARSMETVCGVLEPASSLIQGNSFESECWITRECAARSRKIENFQVHSDYRPSGGVFKATVPSYTRASSLQQDGMTSSEFQRDDLSNPETNDIKAIHAFLSAKNVSCDVEHDPAQEKIILRPVSDPSMCKLSMIHAYEVKHDQNPLVHSTASMITDTAGCQSRPGQSEKSVHSLKMHPIIAPGAGKVMGLEEKPNSGKGRFSLAQEEPSELQKVFEARKLILGQDKS